MEGGASRKVGIEVLSKQTWGDLQGGWSKRCRKKAQEAQEQGFLFFAPFVPFAAERFFAT